MATLNTSTWTGDSSGGSRKYRAFMTYTTAETETEYTVTITKLGIEQTTSGTSNWTGGTAYVQISDGGVHTTTKKTRALSSNSWTFSGASSKNIWTGTITWTYPKQGSSYIVSLKLSGGKNGGSAFTGDANGTSSLTIPAKSNPVTISFSGNGGSGYMPPISAYEGDAIEIPDCEYEKQGSTFSYWYSSSGSYTPGQTYIAGSSSVTFYAQWITGYVAPQITGAAAYRVSGTESVTNLNPTSISNGTRGFMKILIEGGDGYTLRTVSMTIAGQSVTVRSVRDSATGKSWYIGYTSNNVMSAQQQYDAICNYSVLTDNGDSISYTYRTIVSKDQFVIDVRADGKAVGLLTEADESVSTPQVDVGGTLRATTLKQGNQNVSVEGHTHTKSEITDLPNIPTISVGTNYIVIGSAKISWGSVSIFASAGTTATTTVSLSGYSSTPSITLAGQAQSTAANYGSTSGVFLTSKSSSSFTVGYFNNGSASHTFDITWIAIGT